MRNTTNVISVINFFPLEDLFFSLKGKRKIWIMQENFNRLEKQSFSEQKTVVLWRVPFLEKLATTHWIWVSALPAVDIWHCLAEGSRFLI